MLTHLEPRVSCTACNSLIAPYNFLQIHAYSYFPRRAAKANLDAYKGEYRAAVQEVRKLEGQNVALKKSTQNAADAFSAAQTKL